MRLKVIIQHAPNRQIDKHQTVKLKLKTHFTRSIITDINKNKKYNCVNCIKLKFMFTALFFFVVLDSKCTGTHRYTQ